MIIKNGYIFTEDGEFQKGRLYIRDDRIEKIETFDAADDTDENGIDAGGMYVLPGFVDIHLHGALGADFCEAAKESFSVLEEYQIQNGVTTIFPATMTLDEKLLCEIC